MRKTTIKIRGMHCRSCEILIEDSLSEISEISKTIANYKRKEIDIYHKTPLPYDKIDTAIKNAGYSIGTEENRTWLTKNQTIYEELFTAGMIAVIIYILITKFGLLSLSLSSESGGLAVGLVAGFSTCMALVGGLVLGLSAKHAMKHPENSKIQNFKPHIFFNLGRIISYTVLGGIIGLAGNALQPSPVFIATLTILAGVLMLIIGIQLTEISPKLSNIKFTLPSSIARALKITQHHRQEYSHKNAFILGALTFFLPCGFTQAMQIYAVTTGSFTAGAFAMGLFALGTLPGLLGIGFLSSILKGSAGKIFFKLAGIAVIIFSLINLQNGLNLAGLNPKDQFKNPPVTNPAQTSDRYTKPKLAEIKDGKQIVRMTQKFNEYSPNTFLIKKGIPVQWIVTSETIYSCASSLMIPDLKILKYLNEGENIIEFTAQKTGKLEFMCTMGMFRGQFTVIN